MGTHRGAAKRILDWAFCLAALPFAAVIGAAVALAVRLDSPGPVLYRQPRVGRNGRLFRICKFRTMQEGSDDRAQRAFMKAYIQGCAVGKPLGGERVLYKPDQDEHLTRVGRILRRTSLDELPQIVNVLKGDMSLVGPRPHVPWEVEEYQPWHRRRLDALPGITGLAQVHGRSGISFDRMVEYDLDYIENSSLGLDLRILGRTLVSWARGEGAA
jgi:lipopolysaccharide/colanic/teichoic acid biosynthesis glycosyltransferase